MKQLCERAKVKPFGFHAIRHLTASILYKMGQPVSVIQAILRHKISNITASIYGHWDLRKHAVPWKTWQPVLQATALSLILPETVLETVAARCFLSPLKAVRRKKRLHPSRKW